MSRTIFVGNLPLDVREREVEDLFAKYGRIADIDLKLPSRPPGFAFVEFSHSEDAQDAVKGRDGYDFDGVRLRVRSPPQPLCARLSVSAPRSMTEHACRPGVFAGYASGGKLDLQCAVSCFVFALPLLPA